MSLSCVRGLPRDTAGREDVKQSKETGSFRINIGAPSIILLLMVFALTVFALLSIRASYNELKLTRSSRESVVSYYQADALVERTRASIDEICAETKSDEAAFAERVKELASDRLQIVEAEYPVVEFKSEINAGSWIKVRLDCSDGTARIAAHIFETEVLDGYSADAFDILDPIWIELDDEELELEVNGQ